MFVLYKAIILVCGVLLHVAAIRAEMRWYNITNQRALCNDYTNAGYFHETYPKSNKWIIFLESGGACYSSKTCNIRFFNPALRAQLQESTNDEFDPKRAWEETRLKQQISLSEIVSPLMTSMYRYRNNRNVFPNGQLEISGTDILDRDCKVNPIFCEYNHVVLPYCSSDLWLGNDTRDMGQETESYFYTTRYQPDNSELQFLFRGAVIFRSAIEDLLHESLKDATDIVVAGSSAGGIGAMNHINWLQETLKHHSLFANLSVISDSSWFINFHGEIHRQFGISAAAFSNYINTSDPELNNQTDFLQIISWLPQCKDMSIGSPCCISAHCLLSNKLYYPQHVPLFATVSLYDVFLLSSSLEGMNALSNDQAALTPGYAVNFLRTIAEYGGEMNSTITKLAHDTDSFSYFATGCFQHIYLATSTLWGNSTIFGEGLVEAGNSIGIIRYNIINYYYEHAMLS